MQAGFFKAICQIGIFLVCAQSIVHFRPDGSYEKYMKLLVSIMVLTQLLQPLGHLFSRGGGGDLEERVQRIREQLEAGMAEALEESAYSDALLERMTLQELNRVLEEQAAQDAAEASAAASAKEPQADAKEAQENPRQVKTIEPVERIVIDGTR